MHRWHRYIKADQVGISVRLFWSFGVYLGTNSANLVYMSDILDCVLVSKEIEAFTELQLLISLLSNTSQTKGHALL